MAPKRAASAYFVFCNEHRATTKAEYLAQADTEKVSVAVVAKILGEKWRALSDEQRKDYQRQAAEKSAAEQEAEPMDGVENDANEVKRSKAHHIQKSRLSVGWLYLCRSLPPPPSRN
jgi:hypothetical protein